MYSDEEIKKAVEDAVIKTFAEMAFIDVVPTEEGDVTIDFGPILSISFSYPVHGGFILYLPNECKKQIVEDVFARDWEELSMSEIDDCLLELLNVLAGNFLHFLCGENIKYNMNFPEVLFDETDITPADSYKKLLFRRGGYPVQDFRIREGRLIMKILIVEDELYKSYSH